PGAHTTVGGDAARVLRTRVLDADTPPDAPHLSIANRAERERADAVLVAHCGGGGTLRIDDLEIDGCKASAATVRSRFGAASLPLA
ncbi:MAG TPA: hypothetical protein VGW79_09550, partial [Actinomycetota bacterium]|nr:hypothetical protein [Actinomycetota bacterium]